MLEDSGDGRCRHGLDSGASRSRNRGDGDGADQNHGALLSITLGSARATTLHVTTQWSIHQATGLARAALLVDSSLALSSEREARAALHRSPCTSRIRREMMMFSAIIAAVPVAMGLPKPSRVSRCGSAADRCSLLGAANGLRRAACLSPHSASDVGVVEVAAYRSPSVCVTASTCRRRAGGRMYCRESAPAHGALHGLPIRDGECNKHAEGKVIFVQLQMGGWGWGSG
jgi:hypothetical protein